MASLLPNVHSLLLTITNMFAGFSELPPCKCCVIIYPAHVLFATYSRRRQSGTWQWLGSGYLYRTPEHHEMAFVTIHRCKWLMLAYPPHTHLLLWILVRFIFIWKSHSPVRKDTCELGVWDLEFLIMNTEINKDTSLFKGLMNLISIFSPANLPTPFLCLLSLPISPLAFSSPKPWAILQLWLDQTL